MKCLDIAADNALEIEYFLNFFPTHIIFKNWQDASTWKVKVNGQYTGEVKREFIEVWMRRRRELITSIKGGEERITKLVRRFEDGKIRKPLSRKKYKSKSPKHSKKLII